MLDTLLPWIAILAGFGGLMWSADRFVDGSATIAGRLGVSKLIIGLTVVAFGTSAPEAIVSISSSLKGAGELAVGNALGSNLANIGLVLGITALIAPLPIKGHILKQEYVIMMGVMALAGWFLWDGQLQFWEGIVLMASLLPLLTWIAYSKKQHPEEEEDIHELTMKAGVFWFLVGLTTLIVSAEILVWGAKITATNFGVSPLVIGLTVVAVGTSLPELAASVASALKGHHDIAIGNVIGSNMFNLLLVMGIAPAIAPLAMGPEVFSRDFLAMVGITLVLGITMLVSYLRSDRSHGQLGRLIGLVLLLLYVAYYILLFS
ncbi:MAG: calcium/sodium antiporter [Cellvibrionaceae bacterium]